MEKIIYEYSIIRYVPDVEREEFTNIGLMMMCKRFRWMRTEILINQHRLAHFLSRSNYTTDPDHDPRIRTAIERLKIQSAIFTRPDVPAAGLPVEERYRWLAAVKSAILQTSPSHPGLLLPSSDILPPSSDILPPSSDILPPSSDILPPSYGASLPTPTAITRPDAIHHLDAKFSELLRRLIL